MLNIRQRDCSFSRVIHTYRSKDPRLNNRVFVSVIPSIRRYHVLQKLCLLTIFREKLCRQVVAYRFSVEHKRGPVVLANLPL